MHGGVWTNRLRKPEYPFDRARQFRFIRNTTICCVVRFPHDEGIYTEDPATGQRHYTQQPQLHGEACKFEISHGISLQELTRLVCGVYREDVNEWALSKGRIYYFKRHQRPATNAADDSQTKNQKKKNDNSGDETETKMVDVLHKGMPTYVRTLITSDADVREAVAQVPIGGYWRVELERGGSANPDDTHARAGDEDSEDDDSDGLFRFTINNHRDDGSGKRGGDGGGGAGTEGFVDGNDNEASDHYGFKSGDGDGGTTTENGGDGVEGGGDGDSSARQDLWHSDSDDEYENVADSVSGDDDDDDDVEEEEEEEDDEEDDEEDEEEEEDEAEDEDKEEDKDEEEAAADDDDADEGGDDEEDGGGDDDEAEEGEEEEGEDEEEDEDEEEEEEDDE